MNTLTKAATLAALVLAVACSSNKSKEDTSGTDASGSSASSSSPYKSPTGSSTGSSVVGKPTATGMGGGAMPTSHTLYFEYDKAELSADAQATADAWAAYLAANPTAKVRLEGHTDERGTREYNVALGERRGNSVLTAMTARGVSERQLSVTSFGEERPVSLGHDESAWSQNRRVEIVQ